MKKLDKLILRAFIGPYLLTFTVVVFILLTIFLLRYFDDFVGKGFGFWVFAEMVLYMSMNQTPLAAPLAILLSSLMTFGNLGQHSELTALKSSGISLLRAIRPIAVFAAFITAFAFYNNNYLVPKANLQAFTILYNIKETKPALDIKPGTFYGGLPQYSIKVEERLSDDETLLGLIIYDHTRGTGNKEVILADSGKMYSIMDESYLVMELYDGANYSEQGPTGSHSSSGGMPFTRTQFEHAKIIFDLSSFDAASNDAQLFNDHRMMKDTRTLTQDIHEMEIEIAENKVDNLLSASRFYTYHLEGRKLDPGPVIERFQWLDSTYIAYYGERHDTTEFQNSTDSIRRTMAAREHLRRQENLRKFETLQTISRPAGLQDSTATQPDAADQAAAAAAADLECIMGHINFKLQQDNNENQMYSRAINQARFAKNSLSNHGSRIKSTSHSVRVYIVERTMKYSYAVACFIMFLIGAPLGAIIKKGGLGVPVLVSILFFIIFYVFSTFGKKWGTENVMDPLYSPWAANAVLLPVGLYFLRQARRDVRLFEADFYQVLMLRLRERLGRRKKQKDKQDPPPPEAALLKESPTSIKNN